MFWLQTHEQEFAQYVLNAVKSSCILYTINFSEVWRFAETALLGAFRKYTVSFLQPGLGCEKDIRDV